MFDALQGETMALRSLHGMFDLIRQPFGGHGTGAGLVAFDEAKQLLVDDVAAHVDAFVTYEDVRAGDELANFVLALAAEGTMGTAGGDGSEGPAVGPAGGRAASILADRIFQLS